ncbi:MAG: hypothetical protein O7C59_00365 [Rickettsia endosymbiont of Ixodes persulcatus]|nr:hypothetical protein [Rickettsia endosymbiont of Ixodes persulcatus]
MEESRYIHKSHNVTVLIYNIYISIVCTYLLWSSYNLYVGIEVFLPNFSL